MLGAAVQADPGLRVTAAGLGGRPGNNEGGRRESLCYLWDQDTLGIAGPPDDGALEYLQHCFITAIKAQLGLDIAHVKLLIHVLGLFDHVLGVHQQNSHLKTPSLLLREKGLGTSHQPCCTRRMAE